MSKQLIDYYADWCGPCKAITPILEQIAKKHSLELVTVNIEDEPERAMTAGVMSIPHVQLVVDGGIEGESIGLKPMSKLEESLGLI